MIGKMGIDDLLEFVFVMDPGEHSAAEGACAEMFAVGTDDDGIIAYFIRETDAYRFRLNHINCLLNP